MKTPALSTIYLDHQRIGLMGDPRPLVAKIVAAAGQPLDIQVLRTRTPDDERGTPLQLDDVVDRTEEPGTPIYLTSSSIQDMSGGRPRVPHDRPSKP